MLWSSNVRLIPFSFNKNTATVRIVARKTALIHHSGGFSNHTARNGQNDRPKTHGSIITLVLRIFRQIPESSRRPGISSHMMSVRSLLPRHSSTKTTLHRHQRSRTRGWSPYTMFQLARVQRPSCRLQDWNSTSKHLILCSRRRTSRFSRSLCQPLPNACIIDR